MGGCFSQGSEPERPYPQRTYRAPDRRCHGEYRCPLCKRWWESACSWPGVSQKCKRCNIDVFAHTQTPLERRNGLDRIDRGRPHPQDLCGRCRALGRFCGSGGDRGGYGRRN